MSTEMIEVAAGDLSLLLQPRTGLPEGLALRSGRSAPTVRRVSLALEVVYGGREERTPFGGLIYPEATREVKTRVTDVHHVASGAVVICELGPFDLRILYTLTDSAPRVRAALTLSSRNGRPYPVRSLVFHLDLDTAPDAQLHAPGNRVRPGLTVAELSTPLTVHGPAGTPGSAGIIGVTAPEGETVLVWPFTPDAIGESTITHTPAGVQIRTETRLAGVVESGHCLTYDPLMLDLQPLTWHDLDIRRMYPGLGVDLPTDQPEWTGAANLFEVFIGGAPFGPRHTYSPYPQVADLEADLERIAELGFDTLQIMPAQPFPSYSVFDYSDITTTYGEEEALIRCIRRAHRLGMRVILDVLMHGVIDQEVVALAADAVRNGPHGHLLTTSEFYDTQDMAGVEFGGQVPWSQHILDFEPMWREGSPRVHPWREAHPEWFYRDSAGRITSVYTHAIDIGHPTWQEYFLGRLHHLIETLDVDGFRFDAPTYNGYPNWSERTKHRASASSTAAVGMFCYLREHLKRAHPDLMFYTEPSGVFLRQSMDVNYNYDEHAQIEDLMGVEGAALGADGTSEIGVRNARDLAAWFHERDSSLPDRAVTAHHIDSHDTFWWPRPGQKWRREQVGHRGAAALASIFATLPGPYMTFVGGEAGIERHLQGLLNLRRRPEFARGVADWQAAALSSPDVYAIVRVLRGRAVLVLVNATPSFCEAYLTLTGFGIARTRDLLTGYPAPLEITGAMSARVRLPGYATLAVELEDAGYGG